MRRPGGVRQRTPQRAAGLTPLGPPLALETRGATQAAVDSSAGGGSAGTGSGDEEDAAHGDPRPIALDGAAVRDRTAKVHVDRQRVRLARLEGGGAQATVAQGDRAGSDEREVVRLRAVVL